MGCVVGFQIYQSEMPRLSNEVSPGPTSLTIARWNFSFVGLRSSRIEPFGDQMGDLILIQLFCTVVYKFLLIIWKHMKHVPRKLWQKNLSGISRSGSENRIIVTLSYESELMFETINDFLKVITKPKDVFQWDSEWKCAFSVRLLNDTNLSECKTINSIISSSWSVCAIIFEPQVVGPFDFWISSGNLNSPSIVVACPGWNRLSISCPESWYFLLLKRCIIALFVSAMTSASE